jgi:NitT/TauT family transport system permease protein
MATDQALYGLDNLETGRDLLGPESRWSRLGRRTWAATWPKLLAIALVLGVWQLFYLSNYHGETASGLMKDPAQVFPNLWNQLLHGNLPQAIGTTMQRAVIGYALALLFGVVIGALVSRIPPLRAAVGSIITGLQTMPSIAWFPFAIIFFGISNAAILFVIVLGSAPSIANGLIAGVDYTPPLLLRAGKVMGLRGVALYRYLILPASLPAFVAGMKQAWAFAWRSLMAGELLVVLGGASLGGLLNDDQQNQDMASVISVMIVILFIGIVVDGVFTKLDLAIRNRRGLLDPAVAS